jgi:hypothetical protein
MDLQPIVRNLIEGGLYKYRDKKGVKNWHFLYEEHSLKKEAFDDESMDQVIDWFYFNILQLEMQKDGITANFKGYKFTVNDNTVIYMKDEEA